MFRYPKNDSGVSLIEVAVFAVIIGSLFLLMGRYFGTSTKVAMEARLNDSALQIAEKISTDLRKLNFYFVMGADSDVKDGTSLGFDHKEYMVNWRVSQMQTELIKFEEIVKAAGFDRFRISCTLMFRPMVRGASSSFDYVQFTPYNNRITEDFRDPSRMKFIDRNGDGQYYNSLFNAATQEWEPELPPVGIKQIGIQIFKNGREVGDARYISLNLSDYSQEAIGTSENKIKLLLTKPRFFDYYHERRTPEQRASLDLPLRRPLVPLYGLTEACREKRFDDVTDGSHGYGGLVVQGQTLPGATVKIFHYAHYSDCRGCPNQLTANSWQRSQEMTVTDPSGFFTMILGDPMMSAIAADHASMSGRFYNSLALIARASFNGETSADSWNYYQYEVLTEPLSGIEKFPSAPSVPSLAPVVGAGVAYNWTIVNTISILLDDVEYPSMQSSIGIRMRSMVEPYPNMPAILANNSVHSVDVEFADKACYKFASRWEFSVNQIEDPTGPVVTFSRPGATVRANPTTGLAVNEPLSLRIVDLESGVDYRTIQIEMDGAPLISAWGFTEAGLINSSYNPTNGELIIGAMEAIPLGPHRITVRAGNFSLSGSVSTVEHLDFTVS